MRGHWSFIACAALIAAIAVNLAHSQTSPVFEVARAGKNAPKFSRTPTRIAFQSALVGNMMAFAYELPLDRIERRPQWMYDQPYDVAVTTAARAELPDQKALLQKLLEEKFGLVVHRASYESPVYYLMAAPTVNLTASKEAEDSVLPEFRIEPSIGSGAPGAVASGHASMGDLAGWLYQRLQLPVFDKTGLKGTYDFEITGLPFRGGAEGIIRAVHDSLGLNLELHHGKAESLIIDHAEQPR